MAKTTFIKKDDTEFSKQLNHFVERLPTYASTVGVTSAERTSIENDAAFFAFIIVWLVLFRDFGTNATAYKDIARKGANGAVLNAVPDAPAVGTVPTLVAANIQKRFSDLVARIKKSPKYTKAIGEDLGIESPDTPFNPSDGKPNLSASLVEGGFPALKFTKGKFEGAQIWKETSTGWEMITVAIHPKYVDESDFPGAGETKIFKYKAIYLYKGKVVGKWSDVISITVTG